MSHYASPLSDKHARRDTVNLSSSDDESEFKFENFLSDSRPKPVITKSSPTVIIVDDSDTDDEFISPRVEKGRKKPSNGSQSPIKSSEVVRLELSDPESNKLENQSVDEITQQFTTIDLTGINESDVDSDETFFTPARTPSTLVCQTPTPISASNVPIVSDKITPLQSKNKSSKFNSAREVLANKWYFFFNETVFDSLLPHDLNFQWNKNLRKTAGYCEYRYENAFDYSKRTVAINLSTKIITDESRLKSTIIHEMCHAATWIISCVKEGHGVIWRGWAEKAGRLIPGLPPITRCHSYSIDTKYKYKCVNCYYFVGRHSKSIDTTRQCCPLCRSRIELVPLTNKEGTPRKLNAFAEFVKNNYKLIEKNMTHSEKMKHLSTRYNESKLQSPLPQLTEK